jgi:hypothetical protein
LVSALEDDAVELVVCDGDGPVGFCFEAGGETAELGGVEEGGPAGLGGVAPVEESEERAG